MTTRRRGAPQRRRTARPALLAVATALGTVLATTDPGPLAVGRPAAHPATAPASPVNPYLRTTGAVHGLPGHTHRRHAAQHRHRRPPQPRCTPPSGRHAHPERTPHPLGRRWFRHPR